MLILGQKIMKQLSSQLIFMGFMISLKLELSSYNINNKLYNIPIYKNLIYIVKEACLKYALSACRTKGEAARMLGLNESVFENELKKFKVEKYFQDEQTEQDKAW